jgi:2,5-diketo-D-gluconate reductase B
VREAESWFSGESEIVRMQVVKAQGAEIPVIGLGTWDLRGPAAEKAVAAALDAGYRHIDTAAMYGNEEQVGAAIRGHSVPREKIFVTTKVWYSDLADGRLQKAAAESLKRLRLDIVDLLLIHWPSRKVPFREQVLALCDAKRRGLARHIGVANFTPKFLEGAVAIADEPIVTNQVEHHPWLDQKVLMETARRLNVSVTSYTPLGRARLLAEPAIVAIADAKGKSPAQIVLRWHLQQPMNIAIPKSSHPGRIEENMAIFDFELSPEEMHRISALARRNGRMVQGAYPTNWSARPH